MSGSGLRMPWEGSMGGISLTPKSSYTSPNPMTTASNYSIFSDLGSGWGAGSMGGDGLNVAPGTPFGGGGSPVGGGNKGWSWLSTPDQQGMAMPVLGAAQGLFNAWTGMQSLRLGKNRLAEEKNQYALNYDAQRTTTNAQLEDRQRARVASNAGAYQSVGDYMKNNGIRSR